MKATSLLAKLRAAGAEVSVDHGRLIIDAPAGAVTAKMRTQLVKHKSELIGTLDAGQMCPGDPVLDEARHETASLFALAYRRHAAVGPVKGAGGASGDDRLANSCGKSVHGVGL